MEVKNLTIEDLYWLAKESIDPRVRKEAFTEMLTRENCPIKYVWEVFIDKQCSNISKKEAATWFRNEGTVKFCVLQYLGKSLNDSKNYNELIHS